MTQGPALLAGVDRAQFAAAMTGRLRAAGMDTGLTATHRFAAGLAATEPRSVRQMYLLASTCLLSDIEDRDTFDRVFAAVFGTPLPLSQRRLHPDAGAAAAPQGPHRGGLRDARQPGGGPVSWATMPAAGEDSAGDVGEMGLPELTPSAADVLATIPFDQMDDAQLEVVGTLLEDVGNRWPTRLARRRRAASSGRVLDLRRALHSAMRQGGDVAALHWSTPVRRPRRVVMLADVSGSMKPYARAYMHLMRGLGHHARAETFAFATTLTRLTPILTHRDARTAVERATDLVGDRFGGTRIGSSLRQLLGSPVWSSMVRGSVLLIASDGWDTDPPERLAAAVSRLQRMSYRLVWVNPRCAEANYLPAVAGMAAALPYCDVMVPGHTIHAVRAVVRAVVED